jgi:hypothetical protein
MAGKMNVHLFQVSRDTGAQPLEDLLKEIERLTLDTRIRNLANGSFRLEHIEHPRSENNATDYWLLEFVKLRFEHGPGKVGKHTAVEGFVLGDDEGFGEETAALYDPKTNHMIIQYNHHGMRASAIERYFNVFDHAPEEVSSYELLMRIDPSAEIKLAQKRFITKLRFKIAPPKMTAAHRDAGISLNRVLELNNDQNGGAIEVTISASRGQTLGQRAMSMINDLRRLSAHDVDEGTDVVSRFEVGGKNDLLDKSDAINMITPKLELTISDLMLGGDRRYTRRSRWDGLLRAQRGWREIMERTANGTDI